MSINNFELIKLLGHGGGFGKVFLSKKKYDKEECNRNKVASAYAIKIIDKDKIDDNTINHLACESKILQITISFPFTVNLLLSFHDPCKVYFVMEYLAGGNLQEHVNRNGAMEIDVARFMLAQLVYAIAHIHEIGYVHCDLKLANMMLGMDGYLKLIDFGNAKVQSKNVNDKHIFSGTLGYMAPEVLRQEAIGRYECARDWWAIGVVGHQLLAGYNFFERPRDSKTRIYTRTLKQTPTFNEIANDATKDFISKLLEKHPAQRLGSGRKNAGARAGEIKAHIFFANINWEKLANKEIDAPIKPQISHPMDTSNFEVLFTKQPVNNEPSTVPLNSYTEIFEAFTYVAPEMESETKNGDQKQTQKNVNTDGKDENTPENESAGREDAKNYIVAALSDPNTFSLNTLLSKKTKRLLQNENIYDLLTIYVSGNLADYKDFYSENKEFVDTQLNHEQILWKMRLVWFKQLMENNAEITLDRLQHELHIKKDNDVESFITKAFKTGLVRARMDKKNGKVAKKASYDTAMNTNQNENFKVKNKSQLKTKCRSHQNKKSNERRGRPSAPREESTCKKCDFVGRRPSDLKLHIRAQHSRLRFQCKKCSKKYKFECNLKRHQGKC